MGERTREERVSRIKEGGKMKAGKGREEKMWEEGGSVEERDRVEEELDEGGNREIRIPTKIVDKFGCKMKGYTLAKFFCFKTANYVEFVTLYFFIGEKNKAAGKRPKNFLNKRKAMEGANEQFMSMFYPEVLKRMKIEAEGKICEWRPIKMA